MEIAEFREWAHRLADWMADYYEDLETFPVKSKRKPGDTIQLLPDHPPASGENMNQIIDDFNHLIMPGMTHWQHPNFHAYFPANASFPSILAEMLTAALASQCMIWDTSPAAAELEERMMDWLKEMCGLPQTWSGVIQDGASTATLSAILTAREKKAGYATNAKGLKDAPVYRVYCSSEAHSSIEKSVRIAGLGDQNLVKISVDDQLAMNPLALRKQITQDLEKNLTPLCIVAAVGTTGTTAVDPLQEIGQIAREFDLWLHVDAAYAGTAMLLPEYRYMIKGAEMADSYVFNPHKWMFTNFDCTAYFVADPEALIRTFTILPEYLKTSSRGQVNDYRDWGIPMGRRFRALKLWFVIRSYGTEGLREKIREHIRLAADFEQWIRADENFELLAVRNLNVVFFRYHPKDQQDEDQLNQLNAALTEKLKADGRIFLTHTKVHGKYTLRMVIAQTYVESKHVEKAWKVIRELADQC